MKTNIKYYDNSADKFAKKFRDAEQLWFWFLRCRNRDNARVGTMPGMRAAHNIYVCEAFDIENLITRLYLSGKLTDGQLSVLKEFGDKHRAPNHYIWAENSAAHQWRDAINTIESAARQKGWIE
ncbi:MAG: hypothetical protein LBL75_00405 [Rickettsiales bacterium]|nr:hypothetical protein [Rickettsiales bacterium]